jgi:hypothetical protein
MKVTLLRWGQGSGWPQIPESLSASLVLIFGGHKHLVGEDAPWRELRRRFPDAICAGCSTAGEIFEGSVLDEELVAAIIHFENTPVRGVIANHITSTDGSYLVGMQLAQKLASPDLRHVLVLSDGTAINGTTLTQGLRQALPPQARVSGGLAGDGARFKRTWVLLGDEVKSEAVVAIGFYGTSIQVSCGFAGGWEPFGPKRKITRSVGNVLYSLDDQPVLTLYKRYLGERAAELPASALLFPLQLMAAADADDGTVRTILGIDEVNDSLRFAGDLPQGQYVRLMRSNSDRLIDGAASAITSIDAAETARAEFVLLVSCVGRKLAMSHRVDEELEAVLEHLPSTAKVTGFYSYGEISPGGARLDCDLHNQTMTITVFAEDRRT